MDWYELLNVLPDADEREIRRAYRRMALTYHPDKNPSPDAIETFQLLTQALEVLVSADQRAAFDRERTKRRAGPASSPVPGPPGGGEQWRSFNAEEWARQSQLEKDLLAREFQAAQRERFSETQRRLEKLKQEGFDRRRALDALLRRRTPSAARADETRGMHTVVATFSGPASAEAATQTLQRNLDAGAKIEVHGASLRAEFDTVAAARAALDSLMDNLTVTRARLLEIPPTSAADWDAVLARLGQRGAASATEVAAI